MKSYFCKRSLFFYFAYAAVLLLVVMIVFDTVSYINTVQSYILQGYTKEVVMAYMPIFSSLMPSYTTEFGAYGLLAAVLFLADAVVGRKGASKKMNECCSDAPVYFQANEPADVQPDEDATDL
jgi:hypothetical protein